MEVDEEDCGSGHFRFPDNSTALNAETIREDPAPSTSRMVVALSSRAFRANKTKERRKLRSIFKPTSHRCLRREARVNTSSTDEPSTCTGMTALPEEALGTKSSIQFLDIEEYQFPQNVQLPPLVQASSLAAKGWQARDMTTILEDSPAPVGPRGSKFRLSGREMRRADRERKTFFGHSRNMRESLSAFRKDLETMKTMSKNNPEALQESMPDEAIAMLKRFHI